MPASSTSAGPTALGLLALLDGIFGRGPSLPRFTLAVMVALWSGRLGTHLFLRVVGKPEEGRYQQLRRQWASGVSSKFLLFFEAQACSLTCCCPFRFFLSAPILQHLRT